MRKFQKYLTPVPKGAGPVLWDQLEGPFDLEIGCGSGEYALRRARAGGRQIIAIEKTRRRFDQFQRAIQKAGKPDNLWAFHTNAVWWLARYGKKSALENIFFLYPNPYPKKKQANLRWVNRPFMACLLELLKPGGIMEFRANREFYWRELKEKMPLFPGMSLKEERRIDPKPSGETPFERKYLARGDFLMALKFIKKP